MKNVTHGMLALVVGLSGCAYSLGARSGDRAVGSTCTLSSVDQFLAATEATAGATVALSGMERNGIDGHRLAYGTFLIEAGILNAASTVWAQRHGCGSRREVAVAAASP